MTTTRKAKKSTQPKSQTKTKRSVKAAAAPKPKVKASAKPKAAPKAPKKLAPAPVPAHHGAPQPQAKVHPFSAFMKHKSSPRSNVSPINSRFSSHDSYRKKAI